jgi:hypothetical protein
MTHENLDLINLLVSVFIVHRHRDDNLIVHFLVDYQNLPSSELFRRRRNWNNRNSSAIQSFPYVFVQYETYGYSFLVSH